MTTFERIKDLADKQGLSLRSIARKAGLGETTIYGWKRRTPDSKKLQAVADVLNVSLDYLVGNEEDTSSNKNEKSVDLNDDDAFLTFDGRPIPEEDRELIKRLLRGK